ncbi:MAG TPA: hypothetical protein VFD66_05475 [Verrucomicrobiae bacterium]|nr:hypothetical protein [Verrucomicrobiae bacterium]
MRIDANSDVPDPISARTTRARHQAAEMRNEIESKIPELQRALENVPVVRPEKVAAAKALVQDPSYPGEETLGKVAGLLAQHMKPEE